MSILNWREVYGDGFEERIWDGRGLSTDDAEQTEPEAEAGG